MPTRILARSIFLFGANFALLACGSSEEPGSAAQTSNPTATPTLGTSPGSPTDSAPTGVAGGSSTPMGTQGPAAGGGPTSPTPVSTPGPASPVTPAMPSGSEPVSTTEPLVPEPAVDPEPGMMAEPTTTPEPGVMPEPAVMPEPGVMPEPVMMGEPETMPEPDVVGVEQSSECPDIEWPSSNGSTNVGGGMTVGGGEVYDGGMAVHEGSLENCAAGDQDSTDPLIEVADGGTVRNVIMGNNVGDGIHCLGSCTIENVWFPNVCDDAISALGGGTVTIRNSGFKNARDKTIQHNGTGTVNIDNVYVETAGKLYRSCGDGCSGSSRTANISNVVAIGVDQVAGVSTNDTVTLQNICVHRTFSICSIYEPGSSDETTSGVNGSNEGPNDNCRFTADDTHALLSRVSGIPFSTESVCGGPNAYKSGSTATSCVDSFDRCLKACAPGGYGFKEIWCDGGRYAEGEGAICAMPTDPVARENLAQERVMGATQMVGKNDDCSTEWDIGIDDSNNANYCVCVKKPGYYESSNWLSWDCQRRWW